MRHFCTVVTQSHLPYARALAASLRATGNAEPLHVLLAGTRKPELPADESLRLLTLDELGGDYPPLMHHYYSAFELCNALKPFLVAYLFRKVGAAAVIYLDSDLFVTDSFERVWHELDTASLLLTPHHFAPPPLGMRHTNEIDVVDLGFLNGGFAAWRAGEVTDRILAWMCERFPVYGFYRYLGMAADQKLLPLLLAYFPSEVRILHDLGLNIAYWNAQERSVTRTGGGWQIAGRSVVFFHMSGYKLAKPNSPCAYVDDRANRELLAAAPWLLPVMACYRELLERSFANHLAWPHEFVRYDGVFLDENFRRLLFRRRRFDRMDREFWRIWLFQVIRMAKRLITGVRPLR